MKPYNIILMDKILNTKFEEGKDMFGLNAEGKDSYFGISCSNIGIYGQIKPIYHHDDIILNGEFIMTREGDCYYIFFNDEEYIIKVPIDRDNMSMPYEREEFIDSINYKTGLNVYIIQDILFDIQIWLIRQFSGGIDF